MSDDLIFREVDEDVRRERYETMWKRYGAYAIGATVLIVAVVAGVVFWQDYQRGERGEAGAAFEAALDRLDAGQAVEAAAAFDQIAASGPGGYRALAGMQAAAARAAAGNGTEALAAYDRLIADGDLRALHRDVVRLKAALLALELDGGDAALQRLGDLPDGGGVFANAAREIRASALLANGDRTGAIAELRAIAEDANATAGQRDRVRNYIMALGG